MGEIIDFPTTETLRPAQAVAACAKVAWTDFVGFGLTEDGDFEIINSDMTAERALWLAEWARRWALGLDDDIVEEEG